MLEAYNTLALHCYNKYSALYNMDFLFISRNVTVTNFL